MLRFVSIENHETQNKSEEGFNRCYDNINSVYYVRNLSKQLKAYLKYCPECNFFQTKRHAPYDSLQPILSPPIPFHTVTMNFILSLSKSKTELNSVLTVTCKYSKRIQCIPRKGTYGAAEWAKAVLERLDIADWDLPKVIISDRDKKFLSELWTELFNRLGVKLL